MEHLICRYKEFKNKEDNTQNAMTNEGIMTFISKDEESFYPMLD
jgi:hypothetical protein